MTENTENDLENLVWKAIFVLKGIKKIKQIKHIFLEILLTKKNMAPYRFGYLGAPIIEYRTKSLNHL